MKISYAITVCNEEEEIEILIETLRRLKRPEDDINILLDKPKASQTLVDLLYKYSSADIITLRESAFAGDFSQWKNELTLMCKGDYIFNIDADEIPTAELVRHLPLFVEQGVEAIAVPRVNTVEGITQKHIDKWGWNVNEKGWINWPDYQMRIYKNSPNIKWIGRVHEQLGGYLTVSILSKDLSMYLVHAKEIDRQEKQNSFYETL
jgi:hypothetical protein